MTGLKPGQEKCINTLDRGLVVAAGAGSGKTFTLTKRIVHAIESGAVDGIERVCAITFTNKAAGELKARVKAELRACGLAEQALKVDDAWVSTIHGMCARILRDHALELDLDPKFKMVESAAAERLLDASIEDVLRRARGGECIEADLSRERLDALFAEYPARSAGPRGTSVESMVAELVGLAGVNVRGFDAFEFAQKPVAPERLVLAVLESFEELAEATRAEKPTESREAFIAGVDQRASCIRAEMEQQERPDCLWALRVLDSLPLPKRVGTSDYKERVNEALDMLRMCVMELRLAAAKPHLETLVAIARLVSARYALAKRAEGVLDNDDLLVLASRAISDHPEIAALYADKFQIVMVDEFQDTDQMQVDMIKRFSGPGACRLCTVGDAQQSIYRFRGADVAVYRRHLEEVRSVSEDDVIKLPDNFRSHADVLSFVDRVFEQPDMFGGEFMSLAPARDETAVTRPFAASDPRIQVQLTSNSYRGATSDAVREEAARRIADVFADLRERGHSAGEMAVLLGGMTHAEAYARALRARGLACVIAGGSVFSDSIEAAIVRDLADVVANPRQTQALFNVLTSPLFELEAGDLLALSTRLDDDGQMARKNLCSGLRSCVRQFREGGASPSWSERLTLAVRVMGDLMDGAGAGRTLVSRGVMRAVVDSGWLMRLEARGAEGLASAANVYKAIRMIEQIERGQAAGPALTARLFAATLGNAKEAPGALSATGGDFVRIMTVHASKGLEFPIVAVGELGDASGSSAKLLSCEVDGRIFVSLDLANTARACEGAAKLGKLPELYASLVGEDVDEDELARAVASSEGALAMRSALYLRERVGDEEEAKRLLYVALTRAEEALVVSLRGMRTQENPNATPKGCLAATVRALVGPVGEGFDVGVSRFAFGGSGEALVEHVALEADDESVVDAAEGLGEAGEPGPLFAVPGVERRIPVQRVPYAPAEDGVFSYTSLADAVHAEDMLDVFACRFSTGVDAASSDGLAVSFAEGADMSGDVRRPSVSRAARNAAVMDEDDGSWAYTGSISADSDKATDLGTAFHRLAQYAVIARDGKELARLPQERVEALSRSCRLDDVQRRRLSQALDRWLACDLAREMAELPLLDAEVPFFVSVGDAYLEGEIDLLGFDAERKHAYVVDYKTGGSSSESEDCLRRKHVLQAACYAYAILLQGAESVEAVFARVEQGRADNAAQPQCVRYRFEAVDLIKLEDAIVAAYARGW